MSDAQLKAKLDELISADREVRLDQVMSHLRRTDPGRSYRDTLVEAERILDGAHASPPGTALDVLTGRLMSEQGLTYTAALVAADRFLREDRGIITPGRYIEVTANDD